MYQALIYPKVQCVARYVAVYIYVRLYGKLEDNGFEVILSSSESQIHWQGLNDLRKSLIQKDMIKEAHAIFRAEIIRAPLKARSQKTEDLLADTLKLPKFHNQFLMVADLKYMFAENAIALHNLDFAKHMANECESALEAWCQESDIEVMADTVLYLKLQYLRLDFISDSESQQKYRAVEVLLQRMKLVSHPWLHYSLETILKWSLQAAVTTRLQEDMVKYLAYRQRLEYENEQVCEDLPRLLHYYISNISTSSNTSIDQQNWLELTDRFLARYPDFCLPALLQLFHSMRVTAFYSICDNQASEIAFQQSSDWGELADIGIT